MIRDGPFPITLLLFAFSILWCVPFAQALLAKEGPQATILSSQQRDVETIRQNVYCPFAVRARLTDMDFQWDREQTASDNVQRFVRDAIDPFSDHILFYDDMRTRQPKVPLLDGLTLTIPASVYGGNFERFQSLFNLIMRTVSNESVEKLDLLREEGDDDANQAVYPNNGWFFRSKGVIYFLNVFLPNYPDTSSRFSYGVDQAVILFQPMSSFQIRVTLKKLRDAQMSIRARFASKGKKYDFAPIMGTEANPAHLAGQIVKPLKSATDRPVAWWRAPPFVDNRDLSVWQRIANWVKYMEYI